MTENQKKLQEAKQLLEQDLISQEDYDKIKASVVNHLSVSSLEKTAPDAAVEDSILMKEMEQLYAESLQAIRTPTPSPKPSVQKRSYKVLVSSMNQLDLVVKGIDFAEVKAHCRTFASHPIHKDLSDEYHASFNFGGNLRVIHVKDRGDDVFIRWEWKLSTDRKLMVLGMILISPVTLGITAVMGIALYWYYNYTFRDIGELQLAAFKRTFPLEP